MCEKSGLETQIFISEVWNMERVATKNNHQALLEHAHFGLYCEFYGLSQSEAVSREDTLAYMEEKWEVLEQLIGGYLEMGKLNQEYCEKYQGCECGVFDENMLQLEG